VEFGTFSVAMADVFDASDGTDECLGVWGTGSSGQSISQSSIVKVA